MPAKRYWIHAVTPVHPGSGRGLGYIDLPVVREAVTGWPYLPGSAVKGVIADSFDAAPSRRGTDPNKLAAFGIDSAGGPVLGTAGSLVFTDAHILCLPVRSFFGTFAWITSPFCLRRFIRDGQVGGLANMINALTVANERALIAPNSALRENDEATKIYLEDLDLNATASDDAGTIAESIAAVIFNGQTEWQDIFKKRFAIVDDNTFTFLCKTGTEVNARICIDNEKGVVKKGALWYEEMLPIETILTGMVWCEKVYGAAVTPADLLDQFCVNNEHLQIGGKASTGKGIVRLIY